jgi:DNA polymerase I-like protein with 3'-5' exonuclease and polymerase domains
MSDWQPLPALPDLRRVGIIALDLETKDGGLLAGRGSAWPWGDGYICGVSIAYHSEEGIRAHYLPLQHPDSANFDREQLFGWLKDLAASGVRIVTQNGLYDWGWLRTEADIVMPASEQLEEIGALATLVDENRYQYSLDALCTWRGLPGKDEAPLREGCKTLGLLPKRKKKFRPQQYLWQLPARYVAPYAKVDSVNTLALFENLNPILDQENTRAAYRLEVDLLPMVLEMRRRGIRIDTNAAEQARDLLLAKRDAVFAEISEKLGSNVSMAEIGRTKWLAETFDQQKISYPRTEKGNPSFTAGNSGWMPSHPHWLPLLIVRADKYNNAAVNFLETYILRHVVNGRVHAEIHPHRSDEGGTRSLRFSYSNPPLQVMPAHDEELAPLIRGVFLPEEGEVWASCDVSQQEFRFIVHYAARHKLRGVREAVKRYRDDPNTDFHAHVSSMTGRDRQISKATNFAKAFGAGVRLFAQMIGKPVSEAEAIYDQYDRELPFVSQLSALCVHAAKRDGYLTLYDGARRHWSQWAPGGTWKKGLGPCPRDEALNRVNDPKHPWHRKTLWRTDTHKATNALIQGSAARHTKRWMRDCWREGFVPLLQMHDALDLSVNSPEQAKRLAQLGCEAVQLEVPMLVDIGYGRSWGDAKHTWEDLHPGTRKAATSVHGFTPSAAPAHINGTQPALSAAQSTIEAPPAIQDCIPLADIIDETIPRSGFIHCRFHDDREPSLKIYDDHYHCFGCGAHGNAVDWLVEAEGLERDEAIEVLESWDRPPMKRPQAQPNQNQARALELWKEAKPIANTLAAQYLAQWRSIDLDALPKNIDDTLRFHSSCPFGPRTRHPCLIALMRDPLTDTASGIQRIALTSTAAKIARRMLGQSGVVKLWAASSQLVIAEGLETTLAAATRISYQGSPLQPAWAVLSASALRRFPIIPAIEQLFILADHDLNNEGQLAAENCKRSWMQAGRRGAVLLPDRPGSDFNDLVIERWGERHG